jgi:glycosyltransferase involved in cell wall biosynthesis
MVMKFSLLVPSYNRPEMIRETVESLLACSAEAEILVSDDASPKGDQIAAVLSDLTMAGRLRLIRQSQNLGWSGNRNELVREASGEWLILLGDDDRLRPDALRRLERWMLREPGADLYGFGYDVIDEVGERVYSYCSPRLVSYEIQHGLRWREMFYFDAVPMWSHHPFTMAIHRRVFRTLRYEKAAGIGDDLLLLWQALNHGMKFTVLPENLFEWRNTFRRRAYSNLSSDLTRLKESRGAVVAELLRDPSLNPRVRDLVFSPTFLRRFLLATQSGVEQAHAALVSGDGASVRRVLSEVSFQRSEGRWDKVWRHLRAARVMGGGHFRQLQRYFSDRKRLDALLKREAL